MKEYPVLSSNDKVIMDLVWEDGEASTASILEKLEGCENWTRHVITSYSIHYTKLYDMVQHGINCMFSYKAGMKKENICLSTVPPSAAPLPCTKYDLPYAVALRDFFKGYRMRAQQNTKYITSSSREATVTHVLNMMISKLTSADIQSTITPDSYNFV